MNTDLILKHVSRHIQLDEEQEAFFCALLQVKAIKKKDYLLRQGDIGKTENFILEGCLRMYTIDDSGQEHIVMFGVEDWWVSDLYSFLTHTPATYFIDALEDTTVAQITKENLDKLYERVPEFERFFRIMLQNAFIAQQQRIQQNLAFTAAEKYLHFIQKYPDLEQRISQKQVAAYLGITPVFLSMLRRRFARK